jgi:hypothetical protein
MDGRLPAAAVSPPCVGAAAVSAVDSSRLASTDRTRPYSQPHRGGCRGVQFRGHLLGSWARSARPADSDGPDARPWTRLVDTGSRRRPALRTPATVRRAASAPTRSRWQTVSRSRSTSRTYAGSGLTWIGIDIKPGTYRSAGPLDGSSGYWARLSDTSGEGIITNDIATGQAVVTIAPPTKRSKRPGCRTGRRSVDTRRVLPPRRTRRTDGCSGGWPSIYD